MRRTDVAATALSLTLLAGALLSAVLVPTQCACGAAVPHPHALFELPGHHHDHEPFTHPLDGETPAGPTVTVPPSPLVFGSFLPIALFAVAFLLGPTGQRSCVWASARRPTGVALRPPDPPPRLSAACGGPLG